MTSYEIFLNTTKEILLNWIY